MFDKNTVLTHLKLMRKDSAKNKGELTQIVPSTLYLNGVTRLNARKYIGIRLPCLKKANIKTL